MDVDDAIGPCARRPRRRARHGCCRETSCGSVPQGPVRRRVGGGALARWPPSAAQTVRAVFPHTAFTKAQTTRYDPGPAEWGQHRTCRVDQGQQSPRTMMYGFFPKELIHLIALTRLTSLLFPPAFVCRLPRPTPVADCSVTRLSPCLEYYSAVRLLTEHRFPFRFCLLGRLP